LDTPVWQNVSVDYSTSDGTASAGVNYTSTSGTLTFGPGDQSESFKVPVLMDGSNGDPNLSVNLTLSNAVNADLGTNSTATLSIVDEIEYHTGSRNTTTTLTSSANPSEWSQPVTLTATVAPAHGSGTPTGYVTFKDGSTVVSLPEIPVTLARGAKLGSSRPGHWEGREDRRLAGLEKARTQSVQVITQKAREAYADLLPIMARMKAQRLSLRDIAEKLNAKGHTTRRGRPWNPVQVARVLKRQDERCGAPFRDLRVG
jgi:hypothetical protein